MKRIDVADRNVINIWECSECKDTAEINPDWYAENGTPMCCDDDMKYVKTQVIEPQS